MNVDGITTDDKVLLSDIQKTSIEDFKKQYAEKFTIGEFPGNYPIRVLHYNIQESYNHFSEEIEQYLQDSSLSLNQTIDYIIGKYKSPRLCYLPDGSHKTVISEPFCSYIWCLSYFLLIHYEYAAQKLSKEAVHPDLIITGRMLSRASKLLTWGILLDKQLTDWDYISTPSPFPTSGLSDSEPLYCLKANSIFKNAILACLYHELGHAVTLSTLPESALPDEIKAYENEADNFMFNAMFKELENCNSFGISLGITVAYFSILLKISPKNIIGSTHPDADSRIFNMLETLKAYCNSIDDELGEKLLSSVYFMSIYCFQVYFQLYNIDPQADGSQRREFDLPEEALSYFFETLDSIKRMLEV